MAYELTVGGYTFQNPPEEYRKLARLSNSPQTAFNRKSSAFYQSDSQDLQFQVEGTLALDAPLGETSDDLDELTELQDLAISGGEVKIEFDPFFSGKGVIEDDPFRQQEGESSYRFTFTVNSETTDDSSYPSHATPDTGNVFELGDLDLGYDPDTVQQNYERQTERVKRLQGIARAVDTEGLIPKVKISGMIDGAGQATLWDKARNNKMAYLNAEFQNGWALIDTLDVRKAPDAPDYLEGMFQYDMDLLIVMDPGSGIGEVSKFVDRDVQDQTEYVSNCDEDGVFEQLGTDGESDALDYRVTAGTGKLDGNYVEWNEKVDTLNASETNYIYVSDGDSDGYGSVNVGTSGFPGGVVQLFEVTTSSDSVDSITDKRSCLTGTRLEGDSLGDLNFSDSLKMYDHDFTHENIVAFTDTMAVTGSTLPWLGIWDTFSESFSMTDGTPDWVGQWTPASETLDLIDGGSAQNQGSIDPDQNPDTQWTVNPGQYDRSGMEYEGGGVDLVYEGSLTTDLAVDTVGSSSVDDSTATLEGDLTVLNVDNADCYFQYRETGTTTWTDTTKQNKTSTGSYSQDVTGLNSDTDYEFRARADGSDGSTAEGSIQTFTTLESGGDLSLGQAMARREGRIAPQEVESTAGVQANTAQMMARRPEASWAT